MNSRPPVRARRRQRLDGEPACRTADPALFFPPDSEGGESWESGRAKALCRACPVQGACLALAVRSGESHGIWGGTMPGERRRMWEKAERLGAVRPLVIRLLAGREVRVEVGDRDAVVYHLISGGWSVERVGKALGLGPAVVLEAYTRSRKVARLAVALGGEVRRTA
ncbi:WhiB family transcriptional regulator [Streptomyces sp. NPDC001941]|uniref:WhiB family transcriptional regulator n=1 Tax=Streptomyces sp. NPDC001941 TaxID=3154659 RepID=UPI003321482D